MRSPSLFAVFLAVAAVLSSAAVSGASYVTTDVSFSSGEARSGKINLHGSIFRPSADSSASFPAALLITGSGPSNKYEAQFDSNGNTVVEPFFDFAAALANSGFIVLTYNKRSCFGPPLCSDNIACTSPGETNCVAVKQIVFDDFVSDAKAAYSFLRNSVQGVDSTSMTVIGHSQGCTVATLVAGEMSPKNVVLLMGSGVTVAELMRLQALRQIDVFQYDLQVQENLPSPSPQIIAGLKAKIELLNCTATIVPQQFELLQSGAFGRSDGDLTSSAVLSGGYVNQSTGEVACPRTCDGRPMVCSAVNPFLTDDCKLQCQAALKAGSGVVALFAQSWYNASMESARKEALSRISFGTSTTRLLSLNSWTDLLVTPQVFGPLHTLLQSDLPGTESFVLGNPTTVAEVRV